MGIEEILEEVKKICIKYQADRLLLFGSFAKGTSTRYSDIDIAVSGVEKIEELREELEGILTLHSFDLVDLDNCKSELLLEEIEQYARRIL